MTGPGETAGAAPPQPAGRVFVAGLLQESNTFSPRPSTRADFHVVTGEAMLERIAATPVFTRAGYTPVASLFAYAVPGGPLLRDDFRSLAGEILHALDEAADASLDEGPLAGVWLYLHGALEVTELGSGEAALAGAIRSRVGAGVPIAVALDFHANNTPELIAAANIVCGYRTAPHVDTAETQARAAELLVRAMRSGVLPRSVMVRLPMLFPGEMATTPAEPLRSLMAEIARADESPGILCASFFCGMAWVDAPHSRASVVVVEEPATAPRGAGRSEAARLAGLFWDRRDEFDFEEETAEPDEAIRRAVAADEGPVFVADSGDNFTAGAPGDSVWYLRRLLPLDLPPTLVAGIACRRAVAAAFAAAGDEETPAGPDRPPTDREDAAFAASGRRLSLELGGELDPDGERLTLDAELLWLGRVLDKSGARNTRAIRVRSVANRSVEVILTEDRVSFTSPAGIESAGARIADYRIVVVKLGYLFDELRRVAARSIMAFTPGSAFQRPDGFVYRKVRRPVYPLDRDASWSASDALADASSQPPPEAPADQSAAE